MSSGAAEVVPTSALAASPPSEQKEYTKEDVAQHKTEGDCWVIFRGHILKVPPEFYYSHPGGPIYLDAAGADATILFEDNGHPDAARDMMLSWSIGRLKQQATIA